MLHKILMCLFILFFSACLYSQNKFISDSVFTIDKQIVPLCNNSKTVIIVIPNIYCSGCVKALSSFFNEKIKSNNNFSLVILTDGYKDNVSFNRGQISHFTSLFPFNKGVCFEFQNMLSVEERLQKKITSCFNAGNAKLSFPLIILVQNSEHKLVEYADFNNKNKRIIKKFCWRN